MIISTGQRKVQTGTMKAYRKQCQYVYRRCQLGHLTLGNALIIAVCILMLPMVRLTTEHAQLVTTYHMTSINHLMNLSHAPLVLSSLNNLLSAMGIQNEIASSNSRCPSFYSRTCHVSPKPAVIVPFSLGKTVVDVVVALLLLSGDVEVNPGPVGKKLALDDLGQVLEEVLDVSAQWYHLGLQLQVKTGTLDSIRAQFQAPREQLLEMLKTWLNTSDNTSWKTLTNALRRRSVGADQLAGALETKYCLGKETKLHTGATACETPHPVTEQTLPCPRPVKGEKADRELPVATQPGTVTKPLEQEQTVVLDKKSVKEHIRQLQERFRDLVICTYRMLVNVDVDVRCFRSSLLALDVFQKDEHQQFINEHLMKINPATTFDDIWAELSKYWNFLNFDLLEHVVSIYGNKDLKDQMESYDQNLLSFRKATRLCDFIDCWPVKGQSPPGTELREFVAKMKHDWDNCTLEDLESLKGVITRKFFLPEFALVLKQIKDGCVVITWLIPAPFVKELLKVIKDTSGDFFIEHKIEAIIIDEQDCYSSSETKNSGYQQMPSVSTAPPTPAETLHTVIPDTSEEETVTRSDLKTWLPPLLDHTIPSSGSSNRNPSCASSGLSYGYVTSSGLRSGYVTSSGLSSGDSSGSSRSGLSSGDSSGSSRSGLSSGDSSRSSGDSSRSSRSGLSSGDSSGSSRSGLSSGDSSGSSRSGFLSSGYSSGSSGHSYSSGSSRSGLSSGDSSGSSRSGLSSSYSSGSSRSGLSSGCSSGSSRSGLSSGCSSGSSRSGLSSGDSSRSSRSGLSSGDSSRSSRSGLSSGDSSRSSRSGLSSGDSSGSSRSGSKGSLAEEYVRKKFLDEISQQVKLLPSVEQYLSKDEVEADSSLPTKYKDYLSSTPAIRAALYTIFNAKMVAKVFSWSQHAESPPPTTMTELFTTFTLKTLIDHLSTHPVYHKKQLKVTTFSDLPTDEHKQFQGLCKMAYEGILNGQQLVFSAAHLPTEFAPLGLMQNIPQLYNEGRDPLYHFIHLTLQEYLAAVHISQLPAYDHTRLFQEQLHNGHFKITLRFLAGLTKLANLPPSITRRLMESDDTRHFCFHFLFEAKDISVTPCSDELFVRPHNSWTPLDYYVTGYAISHSDYTWKVDFSRYLNEDDEKFELFCQGCAAPGTTRCRGHILHADFKQNQITSKTIKSFANIPTCIVQNMQRLHLRTNKLDGRACDLLAKIIPSMSSLEELWLSDNLIGSGGAVEMIKALRGSRVKELLLYNTGIGEPDCEALCELLKSSKSLRHLDIDQNSLSSESVASIITGLSHKSSLTELYISNSDFTMVNVESLASILRDQSNCTLTKLVLRTCNIDGQGASKLAAALCKNSTLKHMNLNYNSIGVKGASSMSDMLQYNTSLEELYLRDDSVRKEGIHQLIKGLEHNQTLRKVELSKKYKLSTMDHMDHKVQWL